MMNYALAKPPRTGIVPLDVKAVQPESTTWLNFLSLAAYCENHNYSCKLIGHPGARSTEWGLHIQSRDGRVDISAQSTDGSVQSAVNQVYTKIANGEV